MQRVQQFEVSYAVSLYVTLDTIIPAGTELLNDIDNTPLLYLGTA